MRPPAREWVELPEPFAALFARHSPADQTEPTAANATTDWLFPGAMPNSRSTRPTSPTSSLTIGVPARAPAPAWRQLVRQVPPAVLAQALGVSPTTAMRHADLAGADYARYSSSISRSSAMTEPI